jgi:CheY-like chemotaxis protein
MRKVQQTMGIEKGFTAASGQQAQLMAKQDRANVVISALHLSDMTGVQLAQAIRADSQCMDVGFILASSESDAGELNLLQGMPRTVLMHKPFDVRKLAQSLAEATGIAASELLPAP